VFVMAFLTVHVLSLVADPKSGVDLIGAVVPGMSRYRNVAVALGTMGLYALLITALTARYTKLLPAGAWLRLHRLAIGVFGLAWAHGVLAGTDTPALRLLYVTAGVLVTLAGANRYWVVRRARTHAPVPNLEVSEP
jgi:DMSO/TMAO reductase YedYZ heme-binding membrane subunit